MRVRRVALLRLPARKVAVRLPFGCETTHTSGPLTPRPLTLVALTATDRVVGAARLAFILARAVVRLVRLWLVCAAISPH